MRGSRVVCYAQKIVTVALIVASIVPGVPALADDAVVTPPVSQSIVPLPVTSNDIIIYALEYTDDRGFGLIELTNPTDKYIDLAGAELLVSSAGQGENATENQCSIPLNVIMTPRSRLLYRQAGLTDVVTPPATFLFSGCQIDTGNNYDKTVALLRGGSVIERVDMPYTSTGTWERKAVSAVSARTGVFATDFKQSAGYTWQANYPYEPVANLPFILREVLPTTKKSCSAESVSVLEIGCREYVKIENLTSETVDLAQFRLRYGNPSGGTSVRLAGMLPALGIMTIYTALDGKSLAIPNDGAVWFEDAMQTMTYPTPVVYAGADLAANLGKSWAEFDGVWTWSEPSPDLPYNTLRLPDPIKDTTVKTLVPCKDGQYRSEETNRCRSIALAGDTLKPCKEGQYRSEETNRCRSLAADVAQTLKPCADDQFRNPETGRCKKIAAADDLPKPCKEGWERNPETNRCRKIKGTSALNAEYPVEPYKQEGAAMATWWVVGAIVAVAAGYGVWEWRHEIAAFGARLFRRNKQ